MAIITILAHPTLRSHLYTTNIQILREVIWDNEGTSLLEILTDQFPPEWRGHCFAVIEGDKIVFKKDMDT